MGQEREIMMLSRVLVLNGLHVPGGHSLLVLSNSEHADNQETAIKAKGLWECDSDHCQKCLSGTISSSSIKRKEQEEQQDECYSIYSLATTTDTTPGIPHRGEPLSGVTLELYDGVPIYTVQPTEKPKAQRGRPRSNLSLEQREALREQKKVEWDYWAATDSWTWDKLEVLKRGDLQTLASYWGLKNPVSIGTNDDLRSAIAELLELE